MQKQIPTAKQLPNKFVYAAFSIAAILFICLKDFSTAIIFGGISLAFDPFDQSQPFDKRPTWQKVWLLVHIMVVFAVIGITIYIYFKKH